MARSSFGAFRSSSIGYLPGGETGVRGGRLSDAYGSAGIKITVEGDEQSDLALAFQGRLQSTIDAQIRELEGAYWRAMNRVVEAGKGRLRADIVAGGFYKAQALAKTWRGATYPKSKNSLEVAGWLTTKIATIIDAFEEGVVIRVQNGGKYLAVPLAPAKAILRRLHRAKQTGSRDGGIGRNAFGHYIRDDSYVDQVASALGTDLVPIIDHAAGKGVLVAENELTLTRGGREAKNQSRAATPIFALVKQAQLRKRIRGRALLREIEQNFGPDFIHALLGELPPQNQVGAP